MDHAIRGDSPVVRGEVSCCQACRIPSSGVTHTEFGPSCREDAATREPLFCWTASRFPVIHLDLLDGLKHFLGLVHQGHDIGIVGREHPIGDEAFFDPGD